GRADSHKANRYSAGPDQSHGTSRAGIRPTMQLRRESLSQHLSQSSSLLLSELALVLAKHLGSADMSIVYRLLELLVARLRTELLLKPAQRKLAEVREFATALLDTWILGLDLAFDCGLFGRRAVLRHP